MSRVYHAINTADVGSKLLLDGGGGLNQEGSGTMLHQKKMCSEENFLYFLKFKIL